MEGFYLTYNNGKGIFGYCGESETQPPFYFKGHAKVFATRKEARITLKRYRENRGVTRLTPENAKKYAIVPADTPIYNK